MNNTHSSIKFVKKIRDKYEKYEKYEKDTGVISLQLSNL